MIDAIFSFPGVDSQRIYGLGICGGGGYLLSCGQMDKRLKKIATVSMFNTGAVRREGFQNSQVDTVLKRLHELVSILTSTIYVLSSRARIMREKHPLSTTFLIL